MQSLNYWETILQITYFVIKWNFQCQECIECKWNIVSRELLETPQTILAIAKVIDWSSKTVNTSCLVKTIIMYHTEERKARPSPLLTSVHGTKRYISYYQRRKVTINPAILVTTVTYLLICWGNSSIHIVGLSYHSLIGFIDHFMRKMLAWYCLSM